MKPPPDEKAVEALRAATRGRKARGKWRIVMVLVVTAILLIAGGIAGLEWHRKAEINGARNAVIEEVTLVRTHFADVTDWPAWYRKQLPPTCNQDAMRAWIEHVERSGHAEGQVAEWADFCDFEGRCDGVDPTPSADDLRRFLADTDALADEARAMLAFESLNCPPKLDNGATYFDVTEPFRAFKLLKFRILALQRLGDWPRVWAELDVGLRLAQKWDHIAALVHLMIQIGMEKQFHSRFVALAIISPPPVEMLEKWRVQPALRPDLGRELLEYELAFYAQATAGFDPDDEETWKLLVQSAEAEWFDYMSPDLDWEEREKAFTGERDFLAELADYLLQLRTTVETPGAGLENLQPDNKMLDPFFRTAALLRELQITRQRTSLVCLLLQTRTSAELDAVLKKAAMDYPNHEVLVAEETLLVRLRYEDHVRQQLPEPLESAEEFYDRYESLTLPVPSK